MGFLDSIGGLLGGGGSGGGLLGTIGTGLSTLWEGAKSFGGTGLTGLKTGLESLTAGTNWVRESLKGIGDSSLFKGISDIWGTGVKAFKEVAGIAGPAKGLASLFGFFPGQGAKPAQILAASQAMGPGGLPPGFGRNPGDRAFAERLMMGNQQQFAMYQMGGNAMANYGSNVMTGMMLGNAARNLFG